MNFIERLKTEQTELAEKLSKLNSFIYNEKLLEIDRTQAALLKTQADVMETYLNILTLRLELLETTVVEG